MNFIFTLIKVKQMKRSTLGYVIFFITATIIVAGQRYVRRVDESKVVAREMFDKALELEMQKRDTVKIFSSYRGKAHVRSLMKVPCPKDSIVVTSAKYGKRKYKLDPYRHEHNMENDPQKRGLQAIVLEKYPLNAETLRCL